MEINNSCELKKIVEKIVDEAKIIDVHTHLFSPDFSDLLLWGIDELITYHYLIAETMRRLDIGYSTFWKMNKKEQADLIWNTLFISNPPYSEACRGVLTVLEKLGLDVSSRNLESYRNYFKKLTVDEYIDKVFSISHVDSVIMTNDPFEPSERKIWLYGRHDDPRFKSALRIDPLIDDWAASCSQLQEWGYHVNQDFSGSTYNEVSRFLTEWIARMKAVYIAVSLPPSFRLPEKSARSNIFEKCLIPVSLNENIPLAMMIGQKKLVNPDLRDAGGTVGKADIETIEYLCMKYPHNKFMLTMLARENQHELCVEARKFRNLMIFGCWWLLNNPILVEETTRMRFEMLGSSFIPQHSDSRVLDQLIYKWDHSKKIIAKLLYDKYREIMETGWIFSTEEIKKDVDNLFRSNFTGFLKRNF